MTTTAATGGTSVPAAGPRLKPTTLRVQRLYRAPSHHFTPHTAKDHP